jgi:predicted dienelactone hydrolase
MPVGGQTAAVVRVVDLFNAPVQRPVRVHLWYAPGSCATSGAYSLCLDAGTRTDRIVFLSHGALGQADAYDWLGDGLAERGWLVAGISHYGESRAYGPETVDVTSVLRPWQRTEDISFALDQFSRRNPFTRAVSWDHVVMVGHSSGGQTAAALAGVIFDVRPLVAYCASTSAAADRGCLYGGDNESAPSSVDARFAAPQRDVRVIATVLLDPALGPAATEDSLRSISLPTLVIGAIDNDFLPFDAHARRYAALIPGARLVELNNGEGHFSFIDGCTHDAEAQGVPVCRDRPQVDRTSVHEGLLRSIAGFLAEL